MPRAPEFGTPASAKYRKPNAPVRRACFATSQGAWVNGSGNHHRAGAVRR